MQVALSDYAWPAALAADLVNTSAEVMPDGDHLAGPAALASFLGAHDVRSDALAGRLPTDDEVAAVRDLRTRIRPAFDSPETAVEVANELATAGGGPALSRSADGQWRWYARTAPGAGLADELALIAGTGLLGVVQALGANRLRICASPTCVGVFADTSRGGKRRYCVPEVCGNRVNVANFRARRQRGGVSSS
ncbi:CGNR zinc finger domain-containing protein [Fodinicola acaciae]|uniref:CGNR zinc finger domain-containing protein n=1 Tax=Fodinicola acaciae TaxID=2681555 RepID=UPI0013D515E6|nr:CGNR zinc finger domain-containing protein [Fodinicola acaciae]